MKGSKIDNIRETKYNCTESPKTNNEIKMEQLFIKNFFEN